MSGLAGVWGLDGRPPAPELVTAMAATIGHRGRHHFGQWSDGRVAVACHLHRVTPESEAERQPIVDTAGHVLVFDGRLDNREELIGALAPARWSVAAPDSELVLAAWSQWGTACLPRLNGEFALAVFDSARRTFVLARDAVGTKPLYYWCNERTFVFASEIKAILAHPDVAAAPNQSLIADLFLLDQLPYEDAGATYFKGIHAVLPGHQLTVTTDGRRTSRFWDFDPSAQTRQRSYEDYVDHLRALLSQAVRRRCRTVGPIAVSYSGGLDSSAVLALADDLRKNGRAAGPLLPISYSPVDDPTTEENQFIGLMESERSLCVQRLPMGTAGDVALLQDAAWYSETPVFTANWGAETPLLNYAEVHGARVVLTGLWSDQLLFGAGYLVDLFVKLAWRDIARHLREYPRWFVDVDASYFRASFFRALLLNLVPGGVRSGLRPFRTALGRPRHHGLISDRLQAEVRRRRPRIAHPKYASAHARDIYQFVRGQSRRLEFEAEGKLASKFGVERTSPFLDRDVIAYLMSIPGSVQNRHGVPRAILRDAMEGILPNAIRLRRWPAEGTTSLAIEQAQHRNYVLTNTALSMCHRLGFCSEARRVDLDTLEFLGLEFWSRRFFSATLSHRSSVREGGAQ